MNHAPDGDLPFDGGGVFRAGGRIRVPAGGAPAFRLGEFMEFLAGRQFLVEAAAMPRRAAA
ncbi:MAG: hypothetical protein WCJ56_11390, partial [bacterium]